MSTPGLPAGYALESQPQQQAPAASGLPVGYTVEEPGNEAQSQQTNADNEASRTRQMLVSGMTGMPSPVMTDEEKQQFEQGKAAGAASVPIVAGGTAAAEAVLPSVLPHTIAGVKAIGAWASKNPFQAWALYNVIKEFIPGAKKFIGLAKSAPSGQ